MPYWTAKSLLLMGLAHRTQKMAIKTGKEKSLI